MRGLGSVVGFTGVASNVACVSQARYLVPTVYSTQCSCTVRHRCAGGRLAWPFSKQVRSCFRSCLRPHWICVRRRSRTVPKDTAHKRGPRFIRPWSELGWSTRVLYAVTALRQKSRRPQLEAITPPVQTHRGSGSFARQHTTPSSGVLSWRNQHWSIMRRWQKCLSVSEPGEKVAVSEFYFSTKHSNFEAAQPQESFFVAEVRDWEREHL